MRRFSAVAVTLYALAVAAPCAGQDPQPVTQEEFKALEPGFKALDTLADLKKASDARNAACMRAFGHPRFCGCLNGRLTLDLSFDDYIVLVTKARDDPAFLALPAAKQRLAGEASGVRDRCLRAAPDTR